MELLIAILLITAGFYVGWNVGANDAANCIGTMVGAGYISFRKAALLMGVFVILGGVTQGHRVMKTVGKGIVIVVPNAYEQYHQRTPPPELHKHFPDERLPALAILVALISAGVFVTAATIWRIPVSTSQAIVGGVAGVGLGIVGMQPDYFRLDVLVKILGCWVISPCLTALLAFGLYLALSRALRRARGFAWSRVIGGGLVLSSCYVSFSLGANDVGNAIGPLLSRFPERGVWLALLGGVAMAVGALTFGQRVTETVGKSLTTLDATSALCAQLSAGLGVHLFSMLGIPVSTSQAVVGAVVGVGLTKGLQAVRKRRLAEIAVGWVVTPACAAVFAMVLYRVVSYITAGG